MWNFLLFPLLHQLSPSLNAAILLLRILIRTHIWPRPPRRNNCDDLSRNFALTSVFSKDVDLRFPWNIDDAFGHAVHVEAGWLMLETIETS